MKKSAILFLTFLTFCIGIFTIKAIYNYEPAEIIYIDPGHGGFDGGAVSYDKTIMEKDLTLSVSLKLKQYLERMGYIVVLTREKDLALASKKSQDIYTRVKMINESACSLYISIHANSYPHPEIRGAQTFYNAIDDNNKYLAKDIMEMLKIVDPYNNREAKVIKDKYLTDHVNKKGCLIEIGFLSNPQELEQLKKEGYQERLAYAIYLGIMKYKGQEYDKR